MRGLFIDPAGKSEPTHRGYAVIDWAPGAPAITGWQKPRLLGTFSGGLPDARALEYGPLDVAVCEGQWANPKASRQSLMTLSAGAGFLLGIAPAPPEARFFVPVYDWKDAMIPGFANAKKEMYAANLRQLFPGVENSHCLDAVGLGMAFARGTFTPAQLKKWRYT